MAGNVFDWKSFFGFCEFEGSDVENYGKLLIQNGVFFDDRGCLDDQALKDIGIEKFGHRKRILMKIQSSLMATSTTASTGPVHDDSKNRAAPQNEVAPSNNVTMSPEELLAAISKPIRPCMSLLSWADIIRHQTPSVLKIPVRIISEDQNRKLRKCEIGNPMTHGRPNKTILMVGAAGAGKSTLINGMLNYLLGVEWVDNFRFVLKDDTETGGSQANSQTRYISAYTVYTDNEILPFDLTIIDTPGYGDTNGMIRDEEITKQIQFFFEQYGNNGVDELHAIGFVTQAPCVRLTHTQRYIFDSMLSVFGKDVEENVVLMITFVDSGNPLALEAVKQAKIPHKHFFRFNNSALYANNSVVEAGDGDEFSSENFWKMGAKSFSNFFLKLGELQGRSLMLTKEVLKERNNLECFVNNIQPLVQMGLAKLELIRQEITVLEQHDAEIDGSKNFTYEVVLTKQKKVNLKPGVHVTNCLKCNSTCHYPCYIPNDEDKHSCAAMKDGKCTVCAGNCEWQKHYNNPYRFEIYVETEMRTAEDLKAKYTGATTGKIKAESLLKALHCEYAASKNDVAEFILQAQQCLRRLDQIALKPNPLSVVEYIELLIATEKREKKPRFSARISELEEYRVKAIQIQKIRGSNGADCVDEFFNDEDVAGSSFITKSKIFVKKTAQKYFNL